LQHRFQEVIDQRLIESYEAELRTAAGCTDIFKESTEDGRKRWSDLKLRIVEHNIRIMAKYYKKIRLSRWVQIPEGGS
jgi:26S proteasome regulatory subunit N5